jgi:hypothetical protein
MAAQGFTVFAVTDIRCAGRGLPIYLEGGPLHGDEAEIPLLDDGVLASHARRLRFRSNRRLFLSADTIETTGRADRVSVREAG